MKQPKKLQKSLHLEYYISTKHNKFVIKLPKKLNFKFQILYKSIDDSNQKEHQKTNPGTWKIENYKEIKIKIKISKKEKKIKRRSTIEFLFLFLFLAMCVK
jgi:hypothetical protein